MKKNIVILIISLITIIILTGIAVGTGITGMIVKTNNEDYKQDPEFYKSLGNYFAGEGEFSKAIPAYEASLILAEDAEVRNNLAVIYHQRGDYNKAIEHIRILAEQEPANPAYQYDLAVNLVDKFRNTEEQSLEDLLEALKAYQKTEELEPGYGHAKENVEVLKEVLKAG